MGELDGAKRGLRRQMKALRDGLGAEERERVDGAICANLLSLAAYQRADVVLPYLSFGSEVDTRRLIGHALDAGKIVALPRVVEGERAMRWYRVFGLDGLERSALGVEEPPVDPVREVDPLASSRALAIVPALTFDAQGYRLGYGGGFYDAFLAVFPGVSAGLCRDVQFVDDLHGLGVVEAHDLSVDVVVTEQCLVKTSRHH